MRGFGAPIRGVSRFVFALGIIAGLAACGGGGSGGVAPAAPSRVVTPSPSPTPLPTLSASASAKYGGTKTETFTYDFAFAFPSPSPGATEPPSTTSYTVATNVTIGTSPNPGGVTSALDVHTVENDQSSLSTATFGTDAWVGNSPASAGGNTELLYAQTQTEPSSANAPVTSTVYAQPQILDELPESNGATWTNVPTSITKYSYASGDTGTRDVHADGTYTDVEQIGTAAGGGGTATLQDSSDGSGLMNGPFFGGGFVNEIAMSAPSSGQVTVTISFASIAVQAGIEPPTISYNDPTWYSTPPVFFTEHNRTTIGVPLPASCTPNSYGTTANDLHRSIVTLDPVVGDIETLTFDSYMISGLPVCLLTNDMVQFAYDFQDNTPAFLALVGKLGLETQTTTEALVLQAGAVGALPSVRTLSAALEAHVAATLDRTRVQRVRAMLLKLQKAPPL